MRLTRAGEYAVRVVLYLAGPGQGRVATRREIAAAMDIPSPFLGKIAQQLSAAGLITISQGPGGGYRLRVPAGEITLLKVVETVEGSIFLNECLIGADVCAKQPGCPVHGVWALACRRLRETLDSVTFEELAGGNWEGTFPNRGRGTARRGDRLAGNPPAAGGMGMDVFMLSRLQFAFATIIHFLFVPLTLGLGFLVAAMETRYARTRDPMYLRMTKFWGKVFLINFAMGVVTGITLEFQFGTNWSRYSAYVGDIFGSLLAIEALGFFFLESTLLGVWIFGWRKLSAKAHATVMWLIALASAGSAIWILTANAWMQHPVGYTIRNGRAELTDFLAVIFNPFALLTILHTLAAAFILSSFVVMGVSAWHLLKKREIDFFTRSFRMALVMGLLTSVFIIIEGDLHAKDLAKVQPTKLAAMESHWETTKGAPLYVLAWPDPENERNLIQAIPVPGALSFLAFGDFDAEVRGLKDFPRDERPPVALTFVSFRVMVGLAGWFVLMMIVGFLRRNKLTETPWYLKLMVISIPLPYVAIELGWVLAEVGRQPWIVYGLMKTRDAFSPITTAQAGISLAAFVGVYILLTALAYSLIIRHLKSGPAAA